MDFTMGSIILSREAWLDIQSFHMIGREKERQIILDCMNSGRPEFIAVYGRRRVGKTFLIKEYFQEHFAFYATGVPRTNTRNQLKFFREALIQYGDDTKTIPSDWAEAFQRLRKVLSLPTVYRDYENGRRVVFLDELPWMDTAKSDFKSALDYFWNSWASTQKDLVLIVCGSATSWVISNLIRDTGGFYHRITRQIYLAPFDLRECEMLLKSNGHQLTRKQVIECYMIFGGIPHYLNYLRPQFSLAQNIDLLFFQENAPLRYEYDQLFSSLFRNAQNYVSIVETLASKKSGMTRAELLKVEKMPQGKDLTKCLDELEQCGFIRKYSAVSKDSTGYIFQLIDSLTLFHLTWLQNQKIDSWMNHMGTPAYYNWCGLAFERVCLLHSRQIKNVLGIFGISSHEYSWHSKKSEPGAQIDLLIDRKDDVINICEIKYSEGKYAISASEEEALIRRREVFRAETKSHKAIQITMITLNGLEKNEHRHIISNEIISDQLFHELP
ncbi:MAG: ATP-binding protein [Clostridia bacterium]|nr:ATP-binding protein [Clostridia bacterium]